MTAPLSAHRLARPLGIALGIVLAALALVSWRVPGGARTLGADVRVEALQTGALGVSPLHPFVSTPSLVPGHRAGGRVSVRNQTGVPLRVRIRALPSTRELDGLLRVRVASGTLALYDGDLSGLRTRGTLPLRMAAAQRRALQVEVSLPAAIRRGYQGRIVDITLQLVSARAR